MEESEIEMTTARKSESRRAQSVVRWRQQFRGRPRRDSKKRVHHSMDGTCPSPAPTALGDAEITNQPASPRPRGSSDFGNELVEFLGSETIQEEVGDNEVVHLAIRIPGQCICLAELDARRIQTTPQNLSEGMLDHCRAFLDTGDPDVWIASQQFHQEATWPLAQQEGSVSSDGFAQVRKPASLESRSSNCDLQLTIKRSEGVKAHRTALGLGRDLQFHQIPATTLPAE